MMHVSLYVFMHKLLHAYKLINILSLDTVAGAIIGALFFAKLLNVHILPYGLIALGLTVWIIYTADHLRDARTIRNQASSERHRFHQLHFSPLLKLMLIALLIDTVMIFFMRKPVLEGGIVLAIVVALYLLVQRYLKFLKELFIAALYTCGILLPSIAISSVKLTPLYILLIIQFFLIALLNLLLFSWFDKDTDRSDQQHSFVTILGESVAKKTICAIIILNFLCIIFIFGYSDSFELAVIYTLMNALLTFIFLGSKNLHRYSTYRILGDAVFLIPVIYLL
jgi:hypothetical protein